MADRAAGPGSCRRCGPRPLARGGAVGLIFLALLTHAGCGSTNGPSPGAAWAEGPVRWLMLAEEERQFKRLRSGREVALFIELFWRRRDPTPLDASNPFLEIFHERVQAADRLYGEEDSRGSLTDRGRALILLGPPPILRHRQRSVVALLPDLDPKNLLESEAETSIVVEEWEYPPAQIPTGLLDLLDQEARVRGIILTFVEGPHHSRLAEGEAHLELAARALATPSLKSPR